MPISNSYPKGIPIEDQDLFVGTKAYNNRTVNYTAQGVADYLSINSKVAIGGQMSFQFTIVPNIPKTIAFEGGLGDNTAFSAITKLIVSAIDVSTANITIFLNYLNNSQILLSQQNQPNFFGHYKIIGYTQIGTSAFYELDLEFIGGNGTIIDKQYYDLVSFVLSTSGSTTVWGDIIGDIEDQTDLINYISSQITIPTLQQVTDQVGGNITADAIEVGGITSGNFSSDGFGVYISDSYDTTYNFNYIPFVGLQIGDGLSQYVTLGNDGRIEFVNSAGGVGVLRSNLLTGYVEWELPDAYGTIALTSDIPTLVEGSGIDIDYTDPLNIIISTTGGGGGSPTGPAGGDLSATYPNPSVVWNNGKSTYDLVYYPLTSNPAGYLTAAAAALTYYPIPTGTISQYIRGDGSLATFPSATIPTLQQVVTAGPTITTAFTHASTSFENTFNDVGIAINNFIDNSAIYYQGNGIIHTKIGLTQRLVFGPFDGLAPTSRAITIPNADGTIALTSDIQTLVEGKNINIVSDEIEVAIPPIVNTSAILGTTQSFPIGIAIDSLGNIYTADYISNQVTRITPEGVSSSAPITGSGPAGIAIDSLGNIYTANSVSDNVTKIDPTGITTTLGPTGSGPVAITIDSSGNIYTANNGSSTVTKIDPAGITTTLGSTGMNPRSITIDSLGNIYTANGGSDNVTKIAPSGSSITLGSTGDSPVGITVDSSGNVYTVNSLSNNVTKITPSGTSSTLGSTGVEPYGITIDSSGNIYTTNANSNSVTKITHSGVSSTLGSTGNSPSGITIDSLGNIYTANRISDNVTKITVDNKRILGVDDNLNIIRVNGSGGGGGGGVTSVGLTMPSAFNVTNSPITSSGDIAVTGAGLVSQYVRGDGTLANFPNSTGGGSSVNYYLNGSVSQGTFGGDTYYQMSKTPILGAGTDFIRTNGAGDGYIASFITDAGDPSFLNIPGGNWNVEFYFQSSATGGSPQFYAELYKVSATNVFSFIANGSANPEGITNGTAVDQYFTSIPVPQTSLLITDRLAVRIYVITSGKTITLHTENGNLCEVLTTFTTGLTALNGLTKQVQYFDEGTSGTDFNISSTTDTHTFNLPTASATNRGALSTTDWSAFNNKQNASTRRNANNSTNNNINYCGVALGTGVSESATVWTITRLTIAASGSITTATATNVAWTNRESVIY